MKALLILTLAGSLLVACPNVRKESRKRGPGAGPATLVDSTPVSDLKVSRVVLYQNGVGYVERRGKLDGEKLALRVRPEQVNDILKSLTVIDQAKGKAISISLPVEKSADKRLQELPRQIREEGGLVSLLSVFRGASVTVDTAHKSFSGRIVGVEPHIRLTAEGKEVKTWQVALLAQGGTVIPVEVTKITNLQLHDRTLDVGLRKSLDISLDSGAWKPVELTVTMTAGAHDLLVSYIIEMPVWKPTYRLVVGEAGKALVQAWAIVDNVTGEDWEQVEVALVAGEPLSFTYDLHTPFFRHRPHLARRTGPTVNPIAAGLIGGEGAGGGYGGLPGAKAGSRRAKKKAARWEEAKEAPAADMDEFLPPEEPEPEISVDALKDSVQTMVSGTQVGALFRYEIADKVTVPDRQSALVSIMTQEVPGEDVYLFRPTTRGAFNDLKPHRSVRFTNESEFSLEQGPIALYRGKTFVGEGFVSRVHTGDTIFIPYAVDDKVLLDAESDEKEEDLKIVKILDGVITGEIKRIATVKYKVRNLRDEAIKVWVKRAKRAGWKLRKPSEGVLDIQGHWYLPVDVAAKAEAIVEVDEAMPVQRRVSLSSALSFDLIQVYVGSADADNEIVGKLNEVLAAKKRLGEIRREQEELEKKKSRWESEQRRARENLDKLNKTEGATKEIKELKSAQLKTLKEAGEEISKLVAELVKLDTEKGQLNTKMAVLFEGIRLGEE